MQKAVFFDRDGIVNKRLIGDYVKNIESFKFHETFFKIFQLFKTHGYLAILVTNQQGIGKELMTEQDLKIVHDFMQTELLARTGFQFDEIYYSPFLKSKNSFCRKPNPGMFVQAIEKYNINAAESFTIGDSVSDVVAGKAVGTTTFLIGDFDKNNIDSADFVYQNLEELLDYLNKIII